MILPYLIGQLILESVFVVLNWIEVVMCRFLLPNSPGQGDLRFQCQLSKQYSGHYIASRCVDQDFKSGKVFPPLLEFLVGSNNEEAN